MEAGNDADDSYVERTAVDRAMRRSTVDRVLGPSDESRSRARRAHCRLDIVGSPTAHSRCRRASRRAPSSRTRPLVLGRRILDRSPPRRARRRAARSSVLRADPRSRRRPTQSSDGASTGDILDAYCGARAQAGRDGYHTIEPSYQDLPAVLASRDVVDLRSLTRHRRHETTRSSGSGNDRGVRSRSKRWCEASSGGGCTRSGATSARPFTEHTLRCSGRGRSTVFGYRPGASPLARRIVVRVGRLLRRADRLGHVAQVDADARPGRRATAHRVDQHVVDRELRRRLGVSRLPALEPRERRRPCSASSR